MNFAVQVYSNKEAAVENRDRLPGTLSFSGPDGQLEA